MIQPKINILIAEDDEGLLFSLSEIFELDFKTHASHNGQDAWTLFVNLRPKIVITDVVMPHMNGVELTKNIKNISPETIVYAISGAQKIYLEHAREAGADAVFEKPNGMKSLFNRVNSLQMIWL